MITCTECGCIKGQPCSCGYSPEQCAVHCNARSPYSAGYVLPVRYDNSGDYVVYEMPQAGGAQPEQEEYLRRNARDADDDDAPVAPVVAPVVAPAAPVIVPFGNVPSNHPLAPIAKGINDFMSSDAMKTAAERFRARFAQIAPNNGPQVGSTFNPTLGAPLDISEIADKINNFAEPFVSTFNLHTNKLIDGFKQTFLTTRRKRDVNTERRDADARLPMLRVREYESGRDQSSTSKDYSKYMTTSRVELQSSQNHQGQNSEKATHCQSCGSKLTDSVCKRCGTYQPQYVEYINGKPVSFYPGAIQAKSMKNPTAESSVKPRYIYDRYGHKYLENNGNLRLIAPQYQQEAMVADQPDFAGLADILNRNYPVIQQINHEQGRLYPQPKEFVKDAIDLIKDVSIRRPMIEKRSADESEPKTEQQSTTTEKGVKAEQPMPRSMYQVLPMKYDGKDGKLVVKVYSAKNAKSPAGESAIKYTNAMDRSKPMVKKFSKNNKQYEILSFDDYRATSDEDVRQVLDHLHGKQTW